MNLRLAAAAATFAAVTLLVGGCKGDDQDALSVVVSLPQQDVPGVAKATLLVDYSGSGAKILSDGSAAACAFILPGISGDFVDDRRGILTIHTSGPRALRGPADIVACRMKAGSADTTAADIQAKLSVRVSAAEDTAGKPIDLAAKSAKPHGGSSDRSESAVEAAQEEAVKAAAIAVPPPPPGAATGSANDKGSAPAPGETRGVPNVPTAAGSPTAARPAPPQPSRPTNAPGSIVRSPVAAAGGGGNGGGNNDGNVPGNQDRDPGYQEQGHDNSAPAYDLVFSVTGSEPSFGALQFEITHLGRGGGFIGDQDQIDCTSMVEAIVAANYVGERVAKVGMISLQGVRMNSNIIRCGFRTHESLSAASFLVQVVDASKPDSSALDPLPTVTIAAITRR